MSVGDSRVQDRLHQQKTCVRWARVDPAKPGGLHLPQLRGDIGFDMECMEDTLIPPMATVDVPVNARLEMPDGYYAFIWNRSSMGKRNLYVDQNLIDTGYRGRLFVLIRNMRLPRPVYESGHVHDDGEIVLRAGERIAQLIFQKVAPLWTVEVEEISTDTDRSVDGFGSTGI